MKLMEGLTVTIVSMSPKPNTNFEFILTEIINNNHAINEGKNPQNKAKILWSITRTRIPIIFHIHFDEFFIATSNKMANESIKIYYNSYGRWLLKALKLEREESMEQ